MQIAIVLENTNVFIQDRYTNSSYISYIRCNLDNSNSFNLHLFNHNSAVHKQKDLMTVKMACGIDCFGTNAYSRGDLEKQIHNTDFSVPTTT